MRRFSADFGHVLILWQTQPIDRQWISEFVESLEFRCAGESRQGVGGASPLRLAALTRPLHQPPTRHREIGIGSGDARHPVPWRDWSSPPWTGENWWSISISGRPGTERKSSFFLRTWSCLTGSSRSI